MSYNLVLDEPVGSDIVEEHAGLNFIIDKELYETSNGFTINSFKQNGMTYYRIIPEVQNPDGGGCGSCTSCG